MGEGEAGEGVQVDGEMSDSKAARCPTCRSNEKFRPREPHDGWLNAWLYENGTPEESEFFRFAWHSKMRKMAGDWADFREKAASQPSVTPAEPGKEKL